jgi:ubiquinone/menaquinone biosynthesis C-methylase UbiE
MDYDKTEIAATYDEARALAPETVRLWQDLLSVRIDRAAISLVIDLGCGTGRFSELLAAHFGVQVIGIDPSQKMVDQARRKPATGNVVYRQGSERRGRNRERRLIRSRPVEKNPPLPYLAAGSTL